MLPLTAGENAPLSCLHSLGLEDNMDEIEAIPSGASAEEVCASTEVYLLTEAP